jgi:hypothetical protein
MFFMRMIMQRRRRGLLVEFEYFCQKEMQARRGWLGASGAFSDAA